MKKTLLLALITVGIFYYYSYSDAATADVLQPAATITYNEDLTVNGTGRFNSIYIGETGAGGVTFFNGTIVNIGEYVPVTFGDDVRIDGLIWGGPNKGNAADQGLKIGDSLLPGLNDINDIGSNNLRWQDYYGVNGNFSGVLTVQDGEVWTAKNDGAGSGLNADLLDGRHAASFAAIGHDHDAQYLSLNGG